MTTISHERQAWLMAAAYECALKSPDPSTQNGAVIYSPSASRILSHGFNGFTRGVLVTPELLQRPLKYSYIAHAERETLYSSIFSRLAIPIDSIMVAVWAACTDCAIGIVQSGITTLVRHADVSDLSSDNERWMESIKIADGILLAGGVEIIEFRGPVSAEPVLHNEGTWNPRTLDWQPAEYI